MVSPASQRGGPAHAADAPVPSIVRHTDLIAFTEAVHGRFRELRQRSVALHEVYRSAEPFPFIVMDDFLPPSVADEVYAEFPGADSPVWTRLPSEDQRGKLVTTDDGQIPPMARALIHELNSGTFVELLEEITGIPHLIADTKLLGGGLHRIERGGKLSVHIDFSHHPNNGLNRRLNLLLYLNKDWSEEFEGHFELWNADVTECRERLLPIFNRCVVFSTSSISFHGHPVPLACPPGEARKSIALYYFSNGRDPEEDTGHNTTFRSTSGDRASIGTLLLRAARSGIVHDLIPPAVYRLAKRGLTGRGAEREPGMRH